MYRVTGITAFGETSIPSPAVTTMATDKTAPGTPMLVKAQQMRGSEVKITWEKGSTEKDLAGFLVGRGRSAHGPFIPLDTVLLPAAARSFTDRNAVTWDKNFYIVAAIDTAGNAARSAPAYAIIKDSIAPMRPRGLSGSIDSNGIVHLHWQWNAEPDLDGYNVYVSNNREHAFYILNPAHIADTSFTDSVTLTSLTRHVYYRICAYDRSGNISPYSNILDLTKPDRVPPVPPVFSRFLVTDTSVTLEWSPSSSSDVAQQRVWRKELKDTLWNLLEKLDKNTVQYTDKNVHRLAVYVYAVSAVDSSGLTSALSFPLQARIYDNGKRMGVRQLIVQHAGGGTIRLSWDYTGADAGNARFVIYRSYNKAGLAMYKSVPGSLREFSDGELPGEGEYQYALKVTTDDGGSSSLVVSQPVTYKK